MKTFCRKSYNSKYYAQNRERILYRRKLQKVTRSTDSQKIQPSSQLSLFEYSNPKLNSSNLSQPFSVEFLIKGLLILLVIANSYFLLSEAVEFYRFNQANFESSLLAAIIVELLLLAFSVIQATKLIWRVAAKTMLILLFAYSSWSFCSAILGKGYGAIDQLEDINKQVSRLEERIKERNTLIEKNLSLGRITMARRLTLEKDKLSEDLTLLDAKKSQRSTMTPKAQIINTWSMVALRLLLQLSNIIILHHLVGKDHKRKGLRLNKTKNRKVKKPLLQLVKGAL